MELTVAEYEELKSLVGRAYEHDDPRLKRLEELIKRCRYLGDGCGRVGVRVDVVGYEPVVLKYVNLAEDIDVLSSEGLDGFSQNRKEVEVYTTRAGGCRYVPRFFDWDEDEWRWIEVELLDVDDNRLDSDVPLSYRERRQLSSWLGVRLDELSRGDHWGRDRRGRWKVVDMGS